MQAADTFNATIETFVQSTSWPGPPYPRHADRRASDWANQTTAAL